MSYITNEDIKMVEHKYGKPIELTTEVTAVPKELEAIRKSQKDGRSHDVALFIFKDDQLLFIAKHFYPAALFRAPSGAAKPGESIIEGGKREAYEETGANVELEKYLLRIKVKFICGDDFIDWTSFVFKAKYISGEIKPIDTREIREARFVNISDIPRFNEIMRKINMAGFRYRVFLTENTMKLLDNEIVK
ncbi:MAG: NUDIX hydrolase [candidate division Zixibacteria bacterium]|nr:NUDIX hydrolase [candidate division Zixibacteria bacterium]